MNVTGVNMAKKLFPFLIFAVMIVGEASAQRFSLSTGAGGYFTGDFGGGFEMPLLGQTMSYKYPYIGGGGFVFFDATYAEVSIGIFGGGGETSIEGGGGPSAKFNVLYTGLDFGLLGKYPFMIKERFTVFPLLSVNYRLMLSAKSDTAGLSPGKASEYSALWLKLGTGVDYSISSNIYLRGEVLYGLRLLAGIERSASLSGIDTLLGHGPEVKIAVGYKFGAH
jgi:hypothetical protein